MFGLLLTPELTMKAAKVSLYCSAFDRRSWRSKLPSFSAFTGTTLNPAITADYTGYEIKMKHVDGMGLTAGFVPCALSGIRQTSRWPSPRDSW